MHTDIENMIKDCSTCQEVQGVQRRETLIQHDIPNSPFTKLGTDLFEIGARKFLLVADYHSKFCIVRQLNDTTSSAVANEMSYICGQYGRPSEIVSDNGPQYKGAPFQRFVNTWQITHSTSSPRYPQSNGFSERMVQTTKATIKKAIKEQTDWNLSLLHLRATPIDSKLPSPGEMMFGRRLSTSLPCHVKPAPEEQRLQLEARRNAAKVYYDKSAKDLPPLSEGQTVTVYDHQKKLWGSGEVIRPSHEPRSYIVENQHGSQLRRNRRDLREIPNATEEEPVHANVPNAIEVPETDATEPPMEVASTNTVATTKSGRAVRVPARYRDE